MEGRRREVGEERHRGPAVTDPVRPSAMTRVAHDLVGLRQASPREARTPPAPKTGRKRGLDGRAPCDRHPAPAQGQR